MQRAAPSRSGFPRMWMTSRATPGAPGRRRPSSGSCLPLGMLPGCSLRPTAAAGFRLNGGRRRPGGAWPPSHSVSPRGRAAW
eukprot:6337549-Alexandrium_andersonii.AAC.1